MNRALVRAVAGVAGDLVGGVVVSVLVQTTVALGVDPASDMVQMQRRGLSRAGGPARESEASTTVMEEAVGHAWHLALSAALGAIYGLFRKRLDRRPLASGALWGLAFYPIAFWLLGPLSGLTRPPWREPKLLLLRRPLVHLAFGAITGWVASVALRAVPHKDRSAPRLALL